MSLQSWKHFGLKFSRVFFMVAIAFAALLFVQSHAQAATCKVKLEDVGTIIGKGSTPALAFEDAATKCFDKKADKITRQSASLSEDVGLSIIDICANVRCEG